MLFGNGAAIGTINNYYQRLQGKTIVKPESPDKRYNPDEPKTKKRSLKRGRFYATIRIVGENFKN